MLEEVTVPEDVRELVSYGCLTRMHFVRLLSPRFDNEDHTKDIDFSPAGIRQRWESGYEMTVRAIEHAPWMGDHDPLEGVFLHEPKGTTALEDVAGKAMPAPLPRHADHCATNDLP